MKPYHLIESNAALPELIEEIQRTGDFAIDLEFDKNRFRYGFNLCLMQLATRKSCFIVDPLAHSIEVNQLFPALENPSIKKTVFAFGEDLRLLHALRCIPKNVYDLSNAALLLNYAPQSLSNLILEVLGVAVGKSAQNSNWFKRPLTDTQLEYAADDVLYLHQLREIFEESAQKKGVSAWIEEENERIDHMRYTDLESAELYREKDKHGLTEAKWQVYKRLVDYRETLAKQNNRPGYQIIPREYLLELAADFKRINDWNTARVMPSLHNEKIRKALNDVLNTAMEDALKSGYSDELPAIKKLSREDYLALKKKQQEAEEAKQRIFKPVKSAIEQDYGEHAATFILSRRIMDTIIGGGANELPQYRKNLIKEYAQQLKLDVSPYF
jgi:ribonuclease D